MRLPLAPIWALLTASGASLPTAADELVDGSDPQRLVSLIQDMGYRASLKTDDVGDPLIESSAGGTNFAIVFYGCDAKTHDDCDILLYKVGYDLTDGVDLDVINQWNATKLIGRAYRDDVDDPWLEMTLIVEDGISAENFKTTFDWWEQGVSEFEDHLGI